MPDKRKVLVVDDTETDRLILTGVMEQGGYEVLALEAGSRCLETIERFHPDIVLLDIMLPDTDGLTLLHSIRQTRSTLELPVIMVTGRSESADVVAALRQGANDYVTKPVDAEVVSMRVRTQLDLADLSRKAVQLSELSAAHALVVTYNHQINNALTIAVGALAVAKRNHPEITQLTKIETALQRATGVLKAITEATCLDRDRIEKETYVGDTTMLKLE